MIKTETINNGDSTYSSYKNIIKEILPYLWINDWKIKARIVASVLLMGLRLAVSFGSLYTLKIVIDTLSEHDKNLYFLYLCLIAYCVLWISENILEQLRYYVIYRVLERGMRLLSQRIFEHLLLLSAKFHSDRKTGAITTALSRAQNGFYSIFMAILGYTLPAIIEILTAFTTLCYMYGYLYGGVFFLMVISYFTFTFFGIRWTLKFQNEYIKNDTQSGIYLVDKLLNFETIKFFNNSKYETLQCNKILKEREHTGAQRYEKETLLTMGQWAILGLGLTVITFLSGKAVLSGQLSVGDFVLINGYIIQFTSSENNFGTILYEIRNGFNDMNFIINLLHKQPEVVDNPNAIDINIEQATVAFSNVIFGYTPERTILNDISFSIPAGKTIAVVGPTGIGKSTISKLLFRFYDVQKGNITINGLNINNIKQDSLHKIIGIVPQDTILFNDTLYYNIAYSKPDATFQEVEYAAKLANLDNFIKKLPEGYNTLVGERGLKLSGGEKQRIALARIALKQPKIFIFDEATSALDTQTEREIQNNFQKISEHCTTLIISHRLSTVTHVDEIIVLDKEQIVERGTHAALLNQQGLYSQLWKMQQINEL